jgi:hypothetical protein
LVQLGVFSGASVIESLQFGLAPRRKGLEVWMRDAFEDHEPRNLVKKYLFNVGWI